MATLLEQIRANVTAVYTTEAAATIRSLVETIELAVNLLEELYGSVGVSERILHFKISIWSPVKHGCDRLQTGEALGKQDIRDVLMAAAVLSSGQSIEPFVPRPSGRFKFMKDPKTSKTALEAHATILKSWGKLVAAMEWKTLLVHSNKALADTLHGFAADALNIKEHKRTIATLAHKGKSVKAPKPRPKPY